METKSLSSGTTLEPSLNQSSGNLTDDKEANLHTVDVFQVVILSLILLAGFVGNILVIGVVALKCEMRTRTNILFTNLAIAEIGICVVSVPLMLMGLTKDRWIWGNELCKVNCFMLQFWFLECVFTLITLSLHKYLSVFKPLKRIMNRKRTFLVIICTWIVAFLCAIGPVLGWKTEISSQSEAAACYFDNPTTTLHFAHLIFFSAISYLIPLIGIIIIYFNVIRVIQKHFKRIRDTGIIDDKGIRVKRRIAITISIVIFVFFLCWTPFFVNSVMSLLNAQQHFLRVALYCGFSFSVWSPVILVLRNPRFKRGFGEILMCSFLRGSQVDLGTSFSSNLSHTNPSFDYIEERRCSAWYMSTQKNLLSLEPVPPERRLKLRWIETNL